MKTRRSRNGSGLGHGLLRDLTLAAVVLLGSVPLLAQTQFASFTGTITSKDGSPVPNVEVVATNVATQVKYTARSNNDGHLHDLGAADRHVQGPRGRPRASRPTRRTRSGWSPARSPAWTSRCSSGSAESVEVTGVAPILQTQDAVVGEVISESTIQNMPLNGRNFSQLSLLLPGVVTTEPRQLHRAQELRQRTAQRERPARAGEQLHARRRRHERGRSTTCCPTSPTPTPSPRSGSTPTTTRPSSATWPAP